MIKLQKTRLIHPIHTILELCLHKIVNFTPKSWLPPCQLEVAAWHRNHTPGLGGARVWSVIGTHAIPDFVLSNSQDFIHGNSPLKTTTEINEKSFNIKYTNFAV